jgi:hypothetical protein
MAPQGRAALTAAMEGAWAALLEVRDTVKDHGMGLVAARLTRICTELDDLRAVMEQRSVDPAELAGPVANELASRATFHAQRALGELDVPGMLAGTVPAVAAVNALTATIASAFVLGYGACVDESKSAKTILRDRRRVRK